MYHLYILKCADKTLYTGITTDLERRIIEHNSSKLGAKYTFSRRPVKLVYSKKFENRSTASKEEARIKNLKRCDKLRLIMKYFTKKVYDIVKKIPQGKVLTYKEVAKRAGNDKASRAVGNILNKNFDPLIPCHRVIRSDGKLGGYNKGSERKKEILTKEGYKC